ncbi:response regulator [Luteolibacter sp. GHJ8]|uniref:histidine kinase n=1 Tax=Luteolibacter rhizosphaerae TaxID=2989719 RepID=A0ABT3FZ19_9BACT|nr:response regulator [Luteolibacter rhizosphaerae]MCW1912245.1 response regulator [Luteolibacter rhizosphaerae]
MSYHPRMPTAVEEAPLTASILLVDDRPDKLLALESILDGLHQNLVKVRSGDEALRKLLARDFAVILLDVNMPGLDGFETAALIRQRKRSEATPIIFISAINDTETHVSRGYSLGAVDYILTPVIPEILRAKVAVFVDLFLKTEQIKRQAEEHMQLLQEQAARAQAEKEGERMSFLAEAGNVLSASLDYDQTLRNLARLVVPRLAEFCLIDRIDEEGNLHQVAVAHRDPAQETVLRQIRYPQVNEPGHGAYKVYQSGKPYVRNRVDEAVIGELVPEEDRPLIRLLGPTAFAAVPLRARGEVIGSITMVHTAQGASYQDDDLWLAGELAQRAAIALDNVELYQSTKRAREDAEAANQAKDRFLAMLSHELRTPLTPVITHLVKLSDDEEVPDSLRHPLEVIRRNVELEARLIDDLLDLTRVGSGKMHLEAKVVDVHELLRNAIEICRPDLEAKGLHLDVDLAAKEPHVKADPARLQQVFWNVIKNAVKFTAKGSITVTSAGGPDSTMVITVQDTGIGIGEKILSRVFQPFEQAERGTQGGLGLGLAITKSLVELHSGEINVTSDGEGRGATVTVTLPVVAEKPNAATHARPAKKPAEAGLRILLLEDHPDTNESLTLLLELRGYRVSSAMNVTAALELASNEDFDLLLSDLGLPDGSPEPVMKKVAARNGTVGVALSGFGMEKDIEMSRGFGFSHHLVKPVDVGRLMEILEQCGEEARAGCR